MKKRENDTWVSEEVTEEGINTVSGPITDIKVETLGGRVVGGKFRHRSCTFSFNSAESWYEFAEAVSRTTVMLDDHYDVD